MTVVGNVPMGGDNPIRIQSMTTTNTMDTEACVEQAIRIDELSKESLTEEMKRRTGLDNPNSVSEGACEPRKLCGSRSYLQASRIYG